MTQRGKLAILGASLKEAAVNARAILILSICVGMACSPAAAAGSGGASGLSATSKSAADVEKAFADGIDALKAGDYETAEKKFGEVLLAAPTHPEANYYMALSKIGVGKPKNAVRYLEKAIKARGAFVEARQKLALVKIELGDPDAAREQAAAIEALKEQCAATGDCDQAYVDRVESAIIKIRDALAKFDTPLSVDGPESGESDSEKESSLLFAPRDAGVAKYAAAVRLINESRHYEAIATLYAAQAIVGPHPDILNYLGYAHRKIGETGKALEFYTAALALDPDHKGATEYLGELYLEIGELDKAKRQLSKLDRICAFSCAEREDLARLIARRDGALASR